MKAHTRAGWVAALLLAGTMSAMPMGRAEAQSVNIHFSTAPRMTVVPGTQVYMVREPSYGYDVFRYNNAYWVYEDGMWYRARTWRGPFVMVQQTSVPTAFYQVPREHWRSYPPDWANRGYGSQRSMTVRHRHKRVVHRY